MEAGEPMPNKVQVREQCARQIIELLDQAQPQTPSVRVYRAITGSSTYDRENRIQTFEGLSDVRWEKYGVFSGNDSVAQGSRWFNYGSEHMNRNVPGLPVFAHPKEALAWVHTKSFTELPAIAVLEIPLTHFKDTVKLVKNGMSQRSDRVLAESDLTDLSNGKLIPGECYLAGLPSGSVPESIRQYEKLLRPVELDSKGKIVMERGFELVSDISSDNS